MPCLEISLVQLGAAPLLAFGVVYWAGRRKWLTPDGQLAAWVLGTLLFALGGWRWSLPLVVFFITSSAISRFSSGHAGRRASQVVANGSPPLLFLLAFPWLGPSAWWGYVASLAVLTADTWASEWGRRKHPRAFSLRHLRWEPAGIPGGLSCWGTGASLAGAGLQTLLGGWLAPSASSLATLLAVAVSGVLGMLLDAFLGAWLQGHYRCVTCGQVFEAGEEHPCTAPRKRVAGLPWMTNQTINFVAALAGGLLAWFWTR